MKRASPKDLLVAAGMLLVPRRRRKPRLPAGARERVVPPGEPSPRAELLAVTLLLVAAGCAVAFVVVYALDRLPNQTQLLGLSLGLAFLSVAAALVVVSKRLVVTEEIEDDYPAEEHPEEQDAIGDLVDDSASRFTRRRLFKVALATAGGALGVALLTPAASLGPVLDLRRFTRTPWRRGRRLVNEHDNPYRASDIEEKTFYTAFAEGEDKEQLGASLVVVRLRKDQLRLPPDDKGFDADGIVAFSKICTHAGCAISLYRAPLFPPDAPGPALVCPCHYSTFDPARGGAVTFGPAGRKLPMLPLYTDSRGFLRARGNFDSPVGPSWWGVRQRKAS